MEDRTTVIYVAGSMQQAHMLKNLLERSGIEAFVTNDNLEKGSGVDYIGWATLARVVVYEKDAQVARQIALEHDRDGVEMARQVAEAMADDEKPTESGAPPESWPRCPRCHATRTTRCPICKTTGTDFTEADDEYVWGMGLDEVADEKPSCGGSCASCGGHDALPKPEAKPDHTAPGEDDHDEHRLVLICPMCSEPFLPEFPRRCTWCDHEFDEGFEPDEILPVPTESQGRVMAVAVGLLLLGVVVLAYFMAIL